MTNYMVLLQRNSATQALKHLPLNYKELQLAMDDSDNLLDSFSLLIDMVKERLGFDITIDYIPQNLMINNVRHEINCGIPQ